jgi:hypothetical protein
MVRCTTTPRRDSRRSSSCASIIGLRIAGTSSASGSPSGSSGHAGRLDQATRDRGTALRRDARRPGQSRGRSAMSLDDLVDGVDWVPPRAGAGSEEGSLSVQDSPRQARAPGLIGKRRRRRRRPVRVVDEAGVVHADAQPYLGPRSGLAPDRRHDGRWGDPVGGSVAAARSMKAAHDLVAAGACREPTAAHRCDEGLGAHREVSDRLQRLRAELAQGVVAALQELARDREAGAVAAEPACGFDVVTVIG